MDQTMHGFANRIRGLREAAGYTQSELAKKLSLTRASVNAWEMGISTPSTPFVAELARLFHVTTDYLLGFDDCVTIRTDRLTEKEISALLRIITCFRDAKEDSV